MRRQDSGRARYRMIDGKASVDLKLKNPRQLFDERDPAPFRERDLDDDAARYILESFRELKDHRAVRLDLHFGDLGEFALRPRVIEEAIHAYFHFEREVKRRELREIFRTGFISLFIGMAFLLVCTLIGHGHIHVPGFAGLLLKEGSMILGWVSMWKPVSIFLYEWWPIRASLEDLKALSEIEVQIHALGSVANNRVAFYTTDLATAPA